jgi:alpha-L-fucosidase
MRKLCLLAIAASLGAGVLNLPAQFAHKEGAPAPADSGILRQEFTKSQWEASNFAAAADVQRFRDAKIGMFIHFSLSTHDNADLSWGTCYSRKAPDCGHGPVPDKVWQAYPKDFKLEKFNAKEWVDIAQKAGFKYIVAIAKHHDGFHLWNTAYSEFKITNTPFGRDYLKELADACHAAGMSFGIYYSQRDWYHPDYEPVDPAKATLHGVQWTLKPGFTSPMGERHKKYIEYQFNACRELCTKYGRVDFFWFDAVWYGGMFTAEMWEAEKLTRMIRELQPHILINNRCSLPGDYDTPEQHLGAYQDWRPWESCVCLENGWSYTGGAPKSLDTLARMIVNNACGDGNVLLSWGPHWDGEFDPAQTARLLELGAWLRQTGDAIYGTRGGPWKFTTWGGSTRRGKTVYLHVLNWRNETLRLPAIPGRRVLAAKLLHGAPVAFQQTAGVLGVTVPAAMRQPTDTIIELTLDQPAEGLPAIDAGEISIFNDTTTYGSVVSRHAAVKTSSRYAADRGNPESLVAEAPAGDFAFHTAQEMNPWAEIDLGREISVTGLRIKNRILGKERAATLRVSLSTDGQSWQEVWRAAGGQELWEIPVCDFLAGAQVPGRKVRFLKLDLAAAKPEYLHLRQVEVFGKW